MLGLPTIEFGSELGRDRQRLLRRILGDAIPEVLDELEAFRDGKPAERRKVDGGTGHRAKSWTGDGCPQAEVYRWLTPKFTCGAPAVQPSGADHRYELASPET